MQTISRLYRTKSDIENLSKLRTSIPVGNDHDNYKNIVVNKPWGYEYLIYENRSVAIWILYLKPEHRTSMHCHPNKKTSLIVLKGAVECSGLEGWFDRKEGQGMFIDEAVFHSTVATSPTGAFIMEIESPPNKKDLVRLNDRYGREQGYEGASFTTKDTSAYTYFDFHKVAVKTQKYVLGSCAISLSHYKNPKNIHATLSRSHSHLVSLLSGRFHDSNGKVLLSAGESIEREELDSLQIHAFGDISYLTLSFK